MIILIAKSDQDIERCFPVMSQLRPHITTTREFIARVKHQQSEGFSLAFAEDEGIIHAAAGFRIFDMLSRGRHMYVDDLVTNENSRSKGYGKAMLDWLIAYAKDHDCERFHLDSGVHRFRAHRFYFREGMHIQAYHFALDLADRK